MALDEPNDNDEKFESQGYDVLIEKELFTQTGDVRIDMTYYGFTVDSQHPVGGGGCSGGSCSTGGCG
ncbi:hypothetical protein SAMN02745704_01642 [Paucidesulfovibrio gracilis DSM 16080]|uniref:HesB-like selenoprotein n=1 Tax=Paucidesulfovibrio gracilis DSM 16080 TaxID=1121449 RepID=A0A1T4X1W6_9BACT|nr:hypothetical protein SAMN02745704_01642 [Paucidesulfovibrio gracilis DSM 16080]